MKMERDLVSTDRGRQSPLGEHDSGRDSDLSGDDEIEDVKAQKASSTKQAKIPEKDDGAPLESSLSSIDSYTYLNPAKVRLSQSILNGKVSNSSYFPNRKKMNDVPGSEGSDGELEEIKSKIVAQKAASPVVLQWLQDNYEPAEGVSLPRSTLYAHYVGFCSSMNIEPVNSASFGKLIRSIFPNLKTRRLGTRGYSKYHYYGIRIKGSSELKTNYTTGGPTTPSPPPPSVPTMPAKSKSRNRREMDIEKSSHPRAEPQQQAPLQTFETTTTFPLPVTFQLPEFILPDSITDVNRELGQQFLNSYRSHCQTMVDSVCKHHFGEVEKILRHFWQNIPPSYRLLISSSSFSDLILDRDIIAYRAVCSVLLPNVLQALPVSVPQSIRNFAKQLEPWLSSALEGYPSQFLSKKMNLLKKFAQSLHRQGSLNHLTQAARAVLANAGQVQQMIGDYSRLDIEYLRDQSWIFSTNEEIGMSWQEEFRRNLIERTSLEGWAGWIQDVVLRTTAKCVDGRDFVSLLQQLLLKWSFFWSLIIRDLTIRNAGSFGSFHLLRTLFDEYLFHLVDQRLSSPPPPPPPPLPSLHHHHHHQQQQPTEPPSSSSPFPPSSSSPTSAHPPSQQQSSPIDSFALDSVLHHKEPPALHGPSHRNRLFSDIEKPHPQDEDYGRWDVLASETLLPLTMPPPSYPLPRTTLELRPPPNPHSHSHPPAAHRVSPPPPISSSIDRIMCPSYSRASSPSLPTKRPYPPQILFEAFPSNSITLLDTRPFPASSFDLMAQSSSSVPFREESSSKRLRPEPLPDKAS